MWCVLGSIHSIVLLTNVVFQWRCWVRISIFPMSEINSQLCRHSLFIQGVSNLYSLPSPCWAFSSVKLTLLADVITLKVWQKMILHEYHSEMTALQKLSIASNTLSAVADITISIVLVIILHTAKTGFKRSTDLVNRLVRVAVDSWYIAMLNVWNLDGVHFQHR